MQVLAPKPLCTRASTGRRVSTVTQAVASAERQQLSRRALLAGVAFVSLLPAKDAQANVCALAETEAEEVQCFQAAIERESKTRLGTSDYSSKAAEKTFTAVGGVPVSNLDEEYRRATVKLGEDIKQYATMDINDYKNRVPLIKSLKTEGIDWVSKYARGGSARSDSARRMYIAVDSLIGHLSANGYAPMPGPKMRQMLKSIDEADSFLAIGK